MAFPARYRAASAFPSLGSPFDYLELKPETGATEPKVQDRSRHVFVAMEIRADTVGVRQSEDLRNTMSVDQVLRVDPWSHRDSLRGSTGDAWSC